jgi:PadR family transcriptional regulator, regulatory protein PadR
MSATGVSRLSPKTDLLRGTLDLLILQSLSTGRNHGLGIARRIQQLTGGAFAVGAGSLFPALHRLEESGWLQAEWGDSENNRRAKYYELTRAGRRQLKTEAEQWVRVSGAMARALGLP